MIQGDPKNNRMQAKTAAVKVLWRHLSIEKKTVANFHLIYLTKIRPNKKYAFQYTSSNKINWAYYGISYKMLVSAIFSSFFALFLDNKEKQRK
jgi:hypothetical protein